MATIKYGDDDVEEQIRSWVPVPNQPYRTTYAMKPGDRWTDMPTSDKFHEVYANVDGEVIPAGAAVCRELMADGAAWALFTEQWGGFVVVDSELRCVALDGPHGALIDQLRTANGGEYGGFPDVIAEYPDGRVILCEAKAASTADRLQAKQHEFARHARALLGDRLTLMVVRWG